MFYSYFLWKLKVGQKNKIRMYAMCTRNPNVTTHSFSDSVFELENEFISCADRQKGINFVLK